MTVKRTKPVTLDELWAYEDQHPVVFASPRALMEARMIAGMDRAKPAHHRPNRNGRSHSRRGKTVAH
jgi:hypothetical protein